MMLPSLSATSAFRIVAVVAIGFYVVAVWWSLPREGIISPGIWRPSSSSLIDAAGSSSSPAISTVTASSSGGGGGGGGEREHAVGGGETQGRKKSCGGSLLAGPGRGGGGGGGGSSSSLRTSMGRINKTATSAGGRDRRHADVEDCEDEVGGVASSAGSTSEAAEGEEVVEDEREGGVGEVGDDRKRRQVGGGENVGGGGEGEKGKLAMAAVDGETTGVELEIVEEEEEEERGEEEKDNNGSGSEVGQSERGGQHDGGGGGGGGNGSVPTSRSGSWSGEKPVVPESNGRSVPSALPLPSSPILVLSRSPPPPPPPPPLLPLPPPAAAVVSLASVNSGDIAGRGRLVVSATGSNAASGSKAKQRVEGVGDGWATSAWMTTANLANGRGVGAVPSSSSNTSAVVAKGSTAVANGSTPPTEGRKRGSGGKRGSGSRSGEEETKKKTSEEQSRRGPVLVRHSSSINQGGTSAPTAPLPSSPLALNRPSATPLDSAMLPPPPPSPLSPSSSASGGRWRHADGLSRTDAIASNATSTSSSRHGITNPPPRSLSSPDPSTTMGEGTTIATGSGPRPASVGATKGRGPHSLRSPPPPPSPHRNGHVCWSSGSSGGYGDVKKMTGVTVYGAGCSECHVGLACAFTIRVAPPANWVLNESAYKSGVLFKKELMVTLKGESLIAARVTPDPTDAMAFQVGYRSWDAGAYKAILRADCMNLNYTRNFWKRSPEVATWTVVVNNHSSPFSSTSFLATPSSSSPSSSSSWFKSSSSTSASASGNSSSSLFSTSASTSGNSSSSSSSSPFSSTTSPSSTSAFSSTSFSSGNSSSSTLSASPSTNSSSSSSSSSQEVGGDRKGRGRRRTAESQQQRQRQQQQQQFDEPGRVWMSPCDEGQSMHARWRRDRRGTYRWTPYRCAPRDPSGPAEVVRRLNERGIREINFVGDSHQRGLHAHLHYRLTGGADVSKRKYHGDFNYTVDVGHGHGLLLNYYWVDGIYRNGEFGCSHRGEYSNRRDSFPTTSSSADVVILNAGHWTWYRCAQPERAWSKYLPLFLDWAISAHGEHVPIVFRSASTWPTANFGCTMRTNANFLFANALAKILIKPLKNVFYFDAWEVEAPRYMLSCTRRDFHYSCYRPDGMYGPVGEALVDATLHYLLFQLPINQSTKDK